MRVLQIAVAVSTPYGAGACLFTKSSAKKNERNIPATIFNVSRRQAGNHTKNRAGNRLIRRDDSREG
jgi:hypothetical protein